MLNQPISLNFIMDEERFKNAVADVMSDSYNEVMSRRFVQIEKRLDEVDRHLSDLWLTNNALVKFVNFSRLEAKIIEIEG